MIEEFRITDVLYMMNTFSVTGSRVYNLETLRSQATHGTLKDGAPSEVFDDYAGDFEDDEENTDTAETEYEYDFVENDPVGVIVESPVIDNNEYYNDIDYYTSSYSEEDVNGYYEEPSENNDNEYEDYVEYEE